jgi:hypothetical protein
MASNPELEEAFEKIKQGNASEETGNAWDASHCFREATDLLAHLAAASKQSDDEEQRKIIELYETQRAIYFQRAQNCFVEAVKEEQAHAKESAKRPVVTDEEAELRVTTFAALFSKPIDEIMKNKTTEKPMLQQQMSLEERLSSLNSSLPKGFKTSKERMNDINKGLSRLGLSIYSNSDRSSVETENKSEDEQVADIIAQAKDEVAMLGDADAKKSGIDADLEGSDDEDDSSESDSSLDLEDLGIGADFPRRKAMKKTIVKAQMQLAELLAWLDSVGEREAEKETKEILDESDDELDLQPGKKILRKARKNLQKASLDWPEPAAS